MFYNAIPNHIGSNIYHTFAEAFIAHNSSRMITVFPKGGFFVDYILAPFYQLSIFLPQP